MMYIHSNNEIDNNTSTMGDNSTAAGCNSRLIIQHAHDTL